MRRRKAKPVRPICTCRHGYGMHDSDGCHYEEERHLLRFITEVNDTMYVDEMVRCPCKTYDGPMPEFRFAT